MGTTLSDLLAILAVEVGVLYTVWVWPHRRALVYAASISMVGCLLLAGLFLVAGDGLPGPAALTVGYSLGFIAAVRRSGTLTPSPELPTP